MDAASSLLERAARALRPHDGPRADELERAWAKEPWLVGVTGDDPRTRGDALNALCGAKLFDGAPRAASVRVRRGPRAGCRVTRVDGAHENYEPSGPKDDVKALTASVRETKDRLQDSQAALEIVRDAVPAVVRRRPKWWQLWLWPIYVLLAWLNRKRVVEIGRVRGEADDAKTRADAAAREASAAEARAAARQSRYVETVRGLAGDDRVRELVVETEDGPLPAGVEVIELPPGSSEILGKFKLGDVVVGGGQGPTVDAVLAARDATATGLLLQRARRGRALALARIAQQALADLAAEADAKVTSAEEDFRARLARLEAMRISDPAGFGRALTARLRATIVQGVHALIEHAQVHLGMELASLQKEWIESIANAADNDALGAAIDRIDASSPNVTQRIAGEVRLLVGNGIAGIAYDLQPELVAALRPHGLPEPPRKRVEVATVEMLPSLGGTDAKLGGALRKLTGLFRSFDHKRSDAREKAHARLEQMTNIANAELMDVEPRLHEALATATAAELGTLLARQGQWLTASLTEEQAKVAAERAALAPVAATRDSARAAATELATDIAAA